MTKKSFRTLIMSLLLVCLIVVCGGGVLVACNSDNNDNKVDPDHEHSWQQAWSNDETNHWHACTGCTERSDVATHVYTDDQDATCNVCGYERHIHTLVWVKTDQYKHWQEYSCEHHADEKFNEDDHDWDHESAGGVCETCGAKYDDFHWHTYAYAYDETQHWQVTTCTEHDAIDGEKSAHRYNSETGICVCGLHRDDVTMYGLYKSNATLKGDQVQDLDDWKASLVGVDHYGFNEAGDGVFYATEEDVDGEVKYYAAREIVAKAVIGSSPVADVWFVVKAKIGEDYQQVGGKEVLAIAKTGANGEATLSFVPILGYSGDEELVYVVEVAGEDDLEAGVSALPERHSIEATSQEITISEAATDAVSFDVIAKIGVGEEGMLPQRVIDKDENSQYDLDEDVTEGIYKLTLKSLVGEFWAQGDGQNQNITVSVENGEQNIHPTVIAQGNEQYGGGEAVFYIIVKGDSTYFTINRSVSSVTLTACLEKVEDTTIEVGKPILVKISNSKEEAYSYPVVGVDQANSDDYTGFHALLANLPEGTHVVYNGTNDTTYNYTGLDELQSVLTGSGITTVSFYNRTSRLATYAEDVEFVPAVIDAINTEASFDVEFSEYDAIVHLPYMAWSTLGLSSKLGNIKLASKDGSSTFSQISVAYADVGGSGASSVLIEASDDAVSSVESDGFMCSLPAFVIKNHGGGVVPTLTATIQEYEAEVLTVGETKTINPGQYYQLKLDAGNFYIVTLEGDNLWGFRFDTLGNNRTSSVEVVTGTNVKSYTGYISGEYRMDATAIDQLILPGYTYPENQGGPVKVTIVKGYKDGATEMTIGEEQEVQLVNNAAVLRVEYNSAYSGKTLGVLISSDDAQVNNFEAYSGKFKNNYAYLDDTRPIVKIISSSRTAASSVVGTLPSLLSSSTYSFIVVLTWLGENAPASVKVRIGETLAPTVTSNFLTYERDVRTIYWNEVTGATKYTVYEKLHDEDAFEAVATVNAGDPLFYMSKHSEEDYAQKNGRYPVVSYYIVAEGDDDTKLPYISTIARESLTTETKMSTITIQLPADFEGGWIPLAVGQPQGKSNKVDDMSFIKIVYVKVESGQTEAELVLPVSVGGSGLVAIAVASAGKALDAVKYQPAKELVGNYSYDEEVQTLYDSVDGLRTEVTLTISAKA